MSVQNFLGDVLRTAAVHLLAGTVSKTLEEAGKDLADKAQKAYRQYKKKTGPKQEHQLDAEDAVEVETESKGALDVLRELKSGKNPKRK